MDPEKQFSAWNDVEACIEEIMWFASRRKDLSAYTDENKVRTWAEALESDIADLREAIREARATDR